MTVPISLIAAVAENRVIGRDGDMPWRLPTDLRRFRRLTWGKPVVMGRRTFASLGRPLPGRDNVVVTRDRAFAAPGAHVAHGLEEALAAARGLAGNRGADEVMVIGGAEVYAQALPHARRIYLTRVHLRPDGDTLFPEIPAGEWREVAREEDEGGPDDSAPMSFVTLERVAPVAAPLR